MGQSIREQIESFAEYLTRVRSLSPHTVTAYTKDIRQFSAWLHSTAGRELHPREIDHVLLRSFLGMLRRRGYSSGTVARKLASLRAFFRYLQHHGEIEEDPAALLRSPRATRPRQIPPVISCAGTGCAELREVPARRDRQKMHVPLPDRRPV